MYFEPAGVLSSLIREWKHCKVNPKPIFIFVQHGYNHAFKPSDAFIRLNRNDFNHWIRGCTKMVATTKSENLCRLLHNSNLNAADAMSLFIYLAL